MKDSPLYIDWDVVISITREFMVTCFGSKKMEESMSVTHRIEKLLYHFNWDRLKNALIDIIIVKPTNTEQELSSYQDNRRFLDDLLKAAICSPRIGV